MKLRALTLERLRDHVTGDNRLGPYRSGPKLVRLFNEYGFDDYYEAGFPARHQFTYERLKQINGQETLRKLIEEVLDPLNYQPDGSGTVHDHAAALEDINRFLGRDGYVVAIIGERAKVQTTSGKTVEFEVRGAVSPASQDYVDEHLEKCQRKLREGDFSGAITNARSLCEAVLCDIERQLSASAPAYDGSMVKLYKRVQAALNLDPKGYPEKEATAQTLRGLSSIVQGLAGMSNDMADRHGGGRVKAKQHHAVLAVNAANTLCCFLVASFSHQRSGTKPASVVDGKDTSVSAVPHSSPSKTPS